ncbi:MAG: purine-nucleoside phosphorylase [Gemmatimonadales bacterium]|nr:purine-nucleoside phosphorylase [Gemmatimonadales bacterium]
MTSKTLVDHAAIAAHTITEAIGQRKPTIAIVLGSGLGRLADAVQDAVRIPYDMLAGFHVPSVAGHKGELVVGTLGGTEVILQSGRFHMYEGHSAQEAALPVRVFSLLGATTLIVTNAAGGIRRTFQPGTLMLLSDHINLTGRNPLEGPVFPGDTRFPDMSVAYDAALRARAKQVAASLGVTMEEGVYCGLLGPTYETPAEVRMLERLGADAVGMSTVVEVIAARARGMRCLGISLVTNPAAGTFAGVLDHSEVMEVAGKAGETLAKIVTGVVGEIR